MNLKIQIVIAGYGGEPVTLVASLDNNGILVVVKDIAYREEKVSQEFSLVSNLDLPQTDFRFDDKDLRDTIRSYFTRIAQETLILNNPVARFRPDNKIERDTVDERGQRYRIAPDINNGQIAILAAVAYVERQSGFSAAIDFADELSDLYKVTSF